MKQFLSGASGSNDAHATNGERTVIAAAGEIAVTPVAPAPITREIAPPATNGEIAVAPRESIKVGPKLSEELQVVSAQSVTWRSREHLCKILLDIVSERTGYPPEMIGVDQDLESDLGIDSIKRVEIFSVVQDRLPSSVFEKLAQSNQDLTRVRNLKGWVEALLAAGEAVDA
jgi:acyl carrier protein